MVHGTDQAEGRKVSTEGFDEKIRLRADQRSLKQMLLNLSSSLADAAGRVSTSVA
jgi:hypothetical protein